MLTCRQLDRASQVTNHKTGRVVPLVRAPRSANYNEVPAWLLPLAAGAVASDAASSLLDPLYPLLGAGAVGAVAASYVLGSSVLLPK